MARLRIRDFFDASISVPGLNVVAWNKLGGVPEAAPKYAERLIEPDPQDEMCFLKLA